MFWTSRNVVVLSFIRFKPLVYQGYATLHCPEGQLMSSTNENPSPAYVGNINNNANMTIRQLPGKIFGWMNMDSHNFIKSKSFFKQIPI